MALVEKYSLTFLLINFQKRVSRVVEERDGAKAQTPSEADGDLPKCSIQLGGT